MSAGRRGAFSLKNLDLKVARVAPTEELLCADQALFQGLAKGFGTA
jgi:hypothetical protein